MSHNTNFLDNYFLVFPIILLLINYAANPEYFQFNAAMKICYCGVPSNNGQSATEENPSCWNNGGQCSKQPATVFGEFGRPFPLQPRHARANLADDKKRPWSQQWSRISEPGDVNTTNSEKREQFSAT